MNGAAAEISIQALAEFQNSLRTFVREEYESQRARLSRQYQKPVEDRVEEGFTLQHISIESVSRHGEWICRVPANDSRFREGDIAVLSEGDPEQPLANVIVTAAEDNEIRLLKVRIFRLDDPPGPASSGLQLDEGFVDLEHLYLAAIDDAGKTIDGRERILPLLMGSRKPAMDLVVFEEKEKSSRRAGFDDQQSKAVASALASDLCWLIHGPPGTGKTRVLAWIVSEMLDRGERVMVTSATHRSINNLLEAIVSRIGNRHPVAKIARHHDRDLSISQYTAFGESPLAAEPGAYVIGATPFALRSSGLRGTTFDSIVIDEASQVTLPLALMAMLAGKRYIVAGDHHQLPPVTLSMSGEDAVDWSVFGRLQGRGFDTMLTTTHRLNAPLCQWPDEWFYENRLVPHDSVSNRRLAAGLERTLPPDLPHELLTSEPCAVWAAVPHHGSRTMSGEESDVICRLLLALRDSGYPLRDVAVVVPFRKQARIIRTRLYKELRSHPDGRQLVIDTVERMQGQEREIIIISFTCSELDFAERLADFLFLPQRLNVAATRAKNKLILVASPDLYELTMCGRMADKGHRLRTLFESATRIDLT